MYASAAYVAILSFRSLVVLTPISFDLKSYPFVSITISDWGNYQNSDDDSRRNEGTHHYMLTLNQQWTSGHLI